MPACILLFWDSEQSNFDWRLEFCGIRFLLKDELEDERQLNSHLVRLILPHLGLFLCGYWNNRVYKNRAQYLERQRHRIVNEVALITSEVL